MNSQCRRTGGRVVARESRKCEIGSGGWAAFVGLVVFAFTATGAIAQQADNAKFNIVDLSVQGNTLLSNERLDTVVYPFLGPDKTFDDVESARAALEAAYRTAGFMTVAVVIPEQTVAPDGTLHLKLQVLEQKIGRLTVTGNTHTPAKKILKLAPSLAAGTTPNVKDVERDVYALNRLTDRRVTPGLQAGEEQGTIDAELKVEERLPVHASLELNNRASFNTTPLRASASLSYADLWGRGDTVSLSSQIAPQRPSDAKVYSGSYLAWLPGYKNQFLLYGVRTDSDIAVVGGVNVIGQGSLAGARLMTPLPTSEGFYHSLIIGMDLKDFKEDVKLGADTSAAPIRYWPATIKYQANWFGQVNRSELAVSAVYGTGIGDGSEEFDAKRIGARSNFFHLGLDASQTYGFENDIQIYGSLHSQWAGRPQISNEQFSIGGVESVRGYYESEALGDFGGALQFELRSPSLAKYFGPVFDNLRLYVFGDAGAVKIYDPAAEQAASSTLLGTGLGISFESLRHIKGSVDYALPLRAGPSTRETNQASVYFRISGEL